MPKVKVGIVEDELLIAMGITDALHALGYDATEPALNYTEAMEMVTRENPDILLLDIHLGGSKDGIDVAANVRKQHNIPIIFLTANADADTVEKAKGVHPDAYLVKPYRKNDLYAAIELCLSNFSKPNDKSTSNEATNFVVNDALFIKQGQYYHKVKMDEILYLEAENNYVQVHTLSTKMLVRSNIGDYLDLINRPQFCRVHRSYAVNVEHVQSVNSEYIIIMNTQIPLAKAYRDKLLACLKLG